MPHIVREEHIDEICAGCKQPHGNQIELMHQHHRIYEIITCVNCGYEMIRLKEEEPFNDRFQFI